MLPLELNEAEIKIHLYLVEITNDFIQKSDALKALFVYVIFSVELLVVWYRGKHHTNVVVLLGVKLIWSSSLINKTKY